MLRSGQLHLCAITLLAPHLTEDNSRKLLAAARHKSKRRIQEMLRDLAPKPDVEDSVRKLPDTQPSVAAPSTAPAAAAQQPFATSPSASPGLPESSSRNTPSSVTAAPPVPAATKPVRHTEPLGLGRYKVQFTADERVRRKIERARDLTRKKNPTGDLATLLEAALDQFILAESKRQHGATERPRTSKQAPERPGPSKPQSTPETAQPTKPSRHVPNDVKRRVFARDGGQCTFVSADGRRCKERGGLQYHHEIPFAKGGPTTPENIRLLCPCHNALLARKDDGEKVIEARICAARRGQPHPRGALTGEPLWHAGAPVTAGGTAAGVVAERPLLPGFA
jgi:5-methylcytosine-specific restriction endonuclease McrA